MWICVTSTSLHLLHTKIILKLILHFKNQSLTHFNKYTSQFYTYGKQQIKEQEHA
jgi:hypothetical protein